MASHFTTSRTSTSCAIAWCVTSSRRTRRMATRTVTHVVQVATEQVRIPVARARVQRAVESVLRAERVRDAQLPVALVADHRLAALNWRHLGHRGSTDVSSFGFVPVANGAPVTGDVYIAPAVARRNALDHGVGTVSYT